MRIRVTPPESLPGIDLNESGIQLLTVGDFAHHLLPGDGVIVYLPNDDYSICTSQVVCEVVSAHPEKGYVSFDVRLMEQEIYPSSHARHRWKSNPYLCLDKSKVLHYGLLDFFAQAFSDLSWKTRKLEDAVHFVFRPDLAIPTLQPTEGYVYLFKSQNLYKIGKAIDIDKRKKKIERDVSEDLVLIHQIASNDYTRAETILHKRFAHLRKWGEWFDLSFEDIQEICSISEMKY